MRFSHTEEQLMGMVQTFGHGSPEACIEQATACEAKRLVVHHFDPGHDDAKIDEMAKTAADYQAEVGYDGAVDFAQEGKVWEV